MIHSKYREIIDLLIKKSDEDQVNWIYVHNDPTYKNDFTVASGNTTINLFSLHDDSIVFRILDENENQIFLTHQEQFDEEYEVLKKLILLAKKRTNNADHAIDSLINSLKKPGEFGASGAGEKK
jgi:hypothetical protein